VKKRVESKGCKSICIHKTAQLLSTFEFQLSQVSRKAPPPPTAVLYFEKTISHDVYLGRAF